MRPSLRQGLAYWRRAGLLRGGATAARYTSRLAQAVAREARIRVRPVEVKPGELGAALGGRDPVRALRETVLAAMPTVAAFERGLEGAEPSDLVARADEAVAHRFDLLGSGPTDLGAKIDWHSDFKTGRRWPLRHSELLPVSYDDGSDIKVPWELSRCQHLPLLAAAYRVTGKRLYLDELGTQLSGWIAANPVELGPNWACTMDVSIRAANWVAALALCAEEAAGEPWFTETLESLLLHGRFIRAHPEDGDVRGNHYLADLVGLLPVAAMFSGGWEARDWAQWATDELASEMEHQVRGDGCAHEASIPYHRLVTELFLCGTQAADALVPGRLPRWYREQLEAMLGFVAGYTRPDGLAPQIGDGDDGRFLPLDDYGGGDPRDHRHLFLQAGRAFESEQGHAAFPEGGFFVLRADDLHAIVRCGDTGRYGRGGHSHNDQLSFELTVDGEPLVVDPGTYVYTANPEARNLFRSTAFHATLRVDGGEQNELRTDELFTMEDRARAEILAWDSGVFEGRHHGFPGATHTRRIELADRGLRIRDTVSSSEARDLEWTFPVAPGSDDRLEIHGDGLDFEPEQGWYSPRYGVRVPATFLRARRRSRPGEDVTEIVVRARA